MEPIIQKFIRKLNFTKSLKIKNQSHHICKADIKSLCLVVTKVRGLDFPDIKSRLEAQRIMSIKRLIEGNINNSPWKHIPLYHLKNIGGSQGIRHNFNMKLITKTIPPFYQKCL